MATNYTIDPNYYLNGRNGLAVDEARERVYTRAIDTLGDGSADGGFDVRERLDVFAAVDGAVVAGASRCDLYKGAGDVVVDARNGVIPAGRSLAAEFASRLRGRYGLPAFV